MLVNVARPAAHRCIVGPQSYRPCGSQPSDRSHGTALGRVSKVDFEVSLDHCQFQHSHKVNSSFLESGSNSPCLFQPTDAAFDNVSAAIGFGIESGWSARFSTVRFSLLGDHRSDVVVLKPTPNSRNVVAFVASQSKRPGSWATNRLGNTNGVHSIFKGRCFMGLSRRYMDRQGYSVTVSNHVDFGPEPASRAAQCVIGGLVGPPFFPAPAAAT